jgi:hypothetical protein
MATASCATILGIDDGIPRGQDASVSDVQEAATVDGALDGALDAMLEAEVEAAPPPYSPLLCGSNTCNAATQGCCSHKSTLADGAVAYAYGCIEDDGGVCDGGQLITCDRPDNCDKQGHTGEVCCAFGTASPSTVACAPASSCDYPDGGVPAYRICEPGDDELCEPDSGKTCLPSNSAAVGYVLCK